MQTHIPRDRFDFELGYLIQSPCLTCRHQNKRPQCHDDCRRLEQIRTHLARGISTQARER